MLHKGNFLHFKQDLTVNHFIKKILKEKNKKLHWDITVDSLQTNKQFNTFCDVLKSLFLSVFYSSHFDK